MDASSTTQRGTSIGAGLFWALITIGGGLVVASLLLRLVAC